MILTWNDPVHDGGSKVTAYHVEMKEREGLIWRKINRSDVKLNKFKVTNLHVIKLKCIRIGY